MDADGAGPGQAETIFTAYDGNHAWADYNSTGSLTTRYLFGDMIDEIIARFRPGEGTAWYLTDHLGTVRDLVNALGQLVNHIDYDSFGRILAQTNALFGDRFTFTGREWDPTLALYYYRARFYDPHLGRFVSQDPLGFGAGDLNLYRYVGNNPLGATDPTGRQVFLENVATQAFAGAMIGGVLGFICGFLDGLAEDAANEEARLAKAYQRAQEYFNLGVTLGFAIGAGLGLLGGLAPGLAETAGLFALSFGGHLGALWVAQSQNVAQGAVRVGCTLVGSLLPHLLPGPTPPRLKPPAPGWPPTGPQTPAPPNAPGIPRGPLAPAPPNAPGIPRGPGTPAAPPPSAPTGGPAQPTPSIPHPGNIPTPQAPGPGWQWRGQPPAGGRQGNWFNPATGESLSNDMGNTFHGPHWDYRIQGIRGKWRWYPEGRIEYEP